MADRYEYDETLQFQGMQSRGQKDHLEFVDRDNARRVRQFHSLANFVAVPRADILAWVQDFLLWTSSPALLISIFRLSAYLFDLSPLNRGLILLVLGTPLTVALAHSSKDLTTGLVTSLYRVLQVCFGVFLGAL